MLRARANWLLLWKWFRREEPKRSFCSKSINKSNGDKVESSLTNYDEAYRQLDKLDFMTAAKILFTEPPKKKKFGFDFHLVQFFFACMPSLAVYLVAQYARYEMRRMEAELEQKKKKEEEEKAKAMELMDTEATEAEPIPELLEVKVRLDKLEETMKEIMVESKKQSSSDLMKNQEDINGKKPLAATEANSKAVSSESSKSIGKYLESRPDLGQGRTSGSAPVSDASLQDPKSKNHD